jgi:type II secretory pathway pseudopilin PulG
VIGMARSGTGFSLVEVMLGSALLAIAVLAVVPALRGGVRGSARAGDLQLATLLGARAVDGLLATGFDALVSKVDRPAPLDLPSLMGTTDGVIDGFRYTGRYTIQDASSGILPDGGMVLLRLEVEISWQTDRALEAQHIVVIRYVGDPLSGVRF